MGTVIKNRGTSCVGVRKTGTTLIRVSTVMGTLYFDLSEINMLVADTSHFNQEIVDGLKKGMGRS